MVKHLKIQKFCFSLCFTFSFFNRVDFWEFFLILRDLTYYLNTTPYPTFSPIAPDGGGGHSSVQEVLRERRNEVTTPEPTFVLV